MIKAVCDTSVLVPPSTRRRLVQAARENLLVPLDYWRTVPGVDVAMVRREARELRAMRPVKQYDDGADVRILSRRRPKTPARRGLAKS